MEMGRSFFFFSSLANGLVSRSILTPVHHIYWNPYSKARNVLIIYCLLTCEPVTIVHAVHFVLSAAYSVHCHEWLNILPRASYHRNSRMSLSQLADRVYPVLSLSGYSYRSGAKGTNPRLRINGQILSVHES